MDKDTDDEISDEDWARDEVESSSDSNSIKVDLISGDDEDIGIL